MASPILYSFVNTRLKDSYGERGLVISSMMTFGFCSQIWVPLFTFPTVQAPQFPKGYPACVVFEFAMWAILIFGVWYMARWERKHPLLQTVESREDEEVASSEKEDESGASTPKIPETPVETQAVLTLVATRERA